MEQVAERHGLGKHRLAMGRLVLRLRTRKLTHDPVPYVASARARLQDAAQKLEHAEDEGAVVAGALEFADANEDDAVMNLSKLAKAVIPGVPASAIYLALPPSATSELLDRVDSAQQDALVEHLFAKAPGNPDYPLLLPRLPALAAAHAEVAACRAGCQAADAARVDSFFARLRSGRTRTEAAPATP